MTQVSEQLRDHLQAIETAVGSTLPVASLLRLLRLFRELEGNSALAGEMLNYIADDSLRAGRLDDCILAGELTVEMLPDPISYVTLADFLIAAQRPNEARSHLIKSAALARSQNRLVHYSGLALLRFAVRVRDLSLATVALDELLNFRTQRAKPAEDIELEVDMVDGLRSIGIDEARLRAFTTLAGKV